MCIFLLKPATQISNLWNMLKKGVDYLGPYAITMNNRLFNCFSFIWTFYIRRAICKEIIEEKFHPTPDLFRYFYGEMLVIPQEKVKDESMRALIWEVGSLHNINDVRISISNYQRFQTAVIVHSNFRLKYGKRDKIARGEQNLVDTLCHRCDVIFL